MGKLKLKPEEARRVVWEDTDAWDTVEEEIIDKTRWSIIKEGIFFNKKTNKHYRVSWSIGATESQDELPFEYDKEVEFIEVVEKEVVVKKWVAL